MSRRWGDHRDWPDVPERQLGLLRTDAARQLRTLGGEWGKRLELVGEVQVNGLREWCDATVRNVTTPGQEVGRLNGRRLVVEWGTTPGDTWPPERWWWSPLGLAVTAWSQDGWWTQRSGGAVRQYLSAGEIARHIPVSPRTVRRWGENRKRVRQRGTETDGATRMLHRTDVAKLLVMRWSLVFR